MTAHAQKDKKPHQSFLGIKRSRPGLLKPAQEVHPVTRLQRTIGNQAVQRLMQVNGESLKVGSAPTLFESQTKTQQHDYPCDFELIVEKNNYCFQVSLTNKPSVWRVLAIRKDTDIEKTPVSYEAEIELKLVNGKYRTKPTGIFKMCPIDVLSNIQCIWVDEVNFTKMMDAKSGPKYIPPK